METLKIQCIPDAKGRLAPLPAYQTPGSAALDLRAFLPEPIVLQPMERRAIPTGIAIELPQGHCAMILAHSGLATKQGLTMANGVGLIDSDYRGELLCSVVNLSQQPFTIRDGDRIAQLLILPIARVELLPCEALTPTDRGAGGFGSTGRQ